MSRILYRAKSAQGTDVADYVEASSASEAREKLVAAGMREISLLQSPDIAAMSNAPLLGMTSQQQALLRAELMEKPGLATALRGMIRINSSILLLAVALLAFAAWRQDLPLIVVATIMLLLPFGLFFWKRRHANRYQSLMKAYARGQWDEVRRLASLLRDVTHNKLLPWDLDVRLACIEARQGRLDTAVAGLDRWRSELAPAGGMFTARLASVYSAAGDYETYLKLMEEAAALGKQDPSRMVDVALANAKFGNAARAEDILRHLDARLLTPLAPKFVALVQGLLCLRAGQPDKALPLLQTATAGFLESSLKSPAAWVALAICSGYYALALARTGEKQAAQGVIVDVMPILLVHGEKPLLDMLQRDVLEPAV
ncbi:MAG TPA: hypothetical protein VK660_10455 [Xanthomonadaceae bacterium]|jgi:hypothetical protein|nr:hypothetical protein [Xanthomonadaceae bacterium]